MYGHRDPVSLRIRGMLITYCVCDFLFYVYPFTKRENGMLKSRKNNGFQLTDKRQTNLSNLQG